MINPFQSKFGDVALGYDHIPEFSQQTDQNRSCGYTALTDSKKFKIVRTIKRVKLMLTTCGICFYFFHFSSVLNRDKMTSLASIFVPDHAEIHIINI